MWSQEHIYLWKHLEAEDPPEGPRAKQREELSTESMDVLAVCLGED